MKRIFPAIFLAVFILFAPPATAQKYRSIDDTAKLNKEYLNVSLDIIDLNEKLQKAESDLSDYQSKAAGANKTAENAAAASSDQASKATNGSVKDARTAKRRAKKAYREAKDSRSAEGKLSSQEDKIRDYREDIKKKQDRLLALDAMRAKINAKNPAGSATPAE